MGDGSSGQITPANLSTYASSQIDLMSATGRAALNQSVSLDSSQAGAYNYAVINWYTPIAVNGCVGTLCTRNTGATYSGTNTTTTDSLVNATSQEAIVVSANGGTFFKFQKPFTISADDIKNNTSFAVDLVFDPTAAIAGDSASATTGNLRGSGNSIYVPMLSLGPVPKKSSDTTMRETYIAANCGTAGETYRVELYYSSADATSVLGATGGFIMNNSGGAFSIGQADLGSKISDLVTEADGTLTLKTPSATTSQKFATGLKRGANGTMLFDFANSGNPTTSCAYTYTAGVAI